jgi:hypothetical protein
MKLTAQREGHAAVELPTDLTKSEANRLATFIQTLPFGTAD